MQVRRVLADSTRHVPPEIWEACTVSTVPPDILKKIAGVKDVGSVVAVAELELPSMVRTSWINWQTWRLWPMPTSTALAQHRVSISLRSVFVREIRGG
jgi:hypothetical protein